MTEDVGEAGLDKEDSPVKSPQVDQETKFRLERKAREAEAREDLATRLQARARGARSRKQISAMKRVAAAVSQVNHVAKCRLVVLQLIRERNRCAELLQKMVRRRLAKLKVGRARLERLELVIEAVEREYGITELVKGEGEERIDKYQRGAWIRGGSNVVNKTLLHSRHASLFARRLVLWERSPIR